MLLILIRRLALKYGVTPRESFRRPDQEPVALLGGLGIFLACIAGNLYLESPIVWQILIASVPMTLVGLADDIWEVRARTKFIGQIGSVVLWIGMISPKELFYSQMGLPPIAGALVTAIFLMALANSFNFLDGVDGQVGTLAIIAFLALGFAFPSFEIIGFLFASAIAGFLILNFPPAQIYLGEVGASFLGFAAGCLATLIVPGEYPWLKFWGINFVLSLAFCDILTAIIRRIKNGIGPWHPDRDHFHHKLLRIGLSPKHVLVISATIASFSAFTGTYILSTDNVKAASVLAITSGGLLSVIYFSVLALESYLATRVSVFGRTILEKYYDFDQNTIQISKESPVMFFDFLPYYGDLQRRGLKHVDDFVRMMSLVAGDISGKISVKLVGSYTIAIIFKEDKEMTAFAKARIASQIREVLLSFQVLKNTAKIPEGLYIYNSVTAEAQSLLGEQIQLVEEKRSA